MKYIIFILFYCALFFTVFGQEPEGDSTLLTPVDFFVSKGLTLSKSNKYLNFYTNKDNIDASLSMVYDIRWVFSTNEEAKKYLTVNILKLSEEGMEYKKSIVLPNSSEIHIYREPFGTAQFYKSMGAAHAQWYFLFVVDKVVVKIFTNGGFTKFKEPYQIALEAAKHISNKLGLPIDTKNYSISELEINKESLVKIEKAKVLFSIPSGYENSELSSNLTNYYDQQFEYPKEDLIMRTFIVNPENDTSKLEYEKFCRYKSGSAMSIYLNIFMLPIKDFGNVYSKESKDSLECKKRFNGDFMVEAFSTIGKKSVLGKGYKYAYFVAFYKRGYGDCYTIYFANDEKILQLNAQMIYKSFRFK